jgi:hypothetical protein
VTNIAVDWLPREAFGIDAVRVAFDPSIAAWSKNWFVQSKATVSSVVFDGDKPAQATVQRLSGDIASVEVSGRGKRYLVETVLEVNLSEQQLNAGGAGAAWRRCQTAGCTG